MIPGAQAPGFFCTDIGSLLRHGFQSRALSARCVSDARIRAAIAAAAAYREAFRMGNARGHASVAFLARRSGKLCSTTCAVALRPAPSQIEYLCDGEVTISDRRAAGVSRRAVELRFVRSSMKIGSNQRGVWGWGRSGPMEGRELPAVLKGDFHSIDFWR